MKCRCYTMIPFDCQFFCRLHSTICIFTSFQGFYSHSFFSIACDKMTRNNWSTKETNETNKNDFNMFMFSRVPCKTRSLFYPKHFFFFGFTFTFTILFSVCLYCVLLWTLTMQSKKKKRSFSLGFLLLFRFLP